MLLSSASRTSLSALILFYLVYTSLNVYSRSGFHTKAMMIVAVMFALAASVLVWDWMEVWDTFWYNRGMNYTATLPILTQKSSWIAGLGFNFHEHVADIIGTTMLDSFYLCILLEAGIVGFILLIGNILLFTKRYFSDIRHMTKFHKQLGGLLAVMLYYAVFESALLNGGPFDLLNWCSLITVLNDRQVS